MVLWGEYKKSKRKSPEVNVALMDAVIRFVIGAGGWLLDELTLPELLNQMMYAELDQACSDPDFVDWLDLREWSKKAVKLPIEQLLGLTT